MSSKKSPAKYFVGLIVLFVVIASVFTLMKAGGSLSLADSSKTLAVVATATSTLPRCVDYDYSNQSFTNTPPLPLVKGYTYDTISNPKFNPAVIPNPQIEANADYCTLKGVRTSSCSGVGCGLVERYCANNRRSSRFYLYNGRTGYNKLQEVCPNGCSNGACATTTTLNSLIVVNASSITVTPIDNGANPVVVYSATFSVTLQNSGTTNLYVSKVNGNMFSVLLSPSPNASTAISQVMPVPVLSGDTNSSYVIPAGSNRTFNVSARIGKKSYSSTSQSLTITGVNYGLVTDIYNQTVTAGLDNLSKTIVFQVAGNVADLSATLAPSSPLTGKVQINNSGATKTAVPLAVYRFRSSTQNSTLNTLVFNIVSSPNLGAYISNSLVNFQLSDGGAKYDATSVSTAGVVTFSSLNIPLAKDIAKDFTLLVDVLATSSSFNVTPTIDISKTMAVDNNYNTPTYGGVALANITADITGNTLTFISNSLTTIGPSVTVGAGIVDPTVAGSNIVVKYPVAYSFTLTNLGVSDLFVSKNIGVFVSTTTLVAPIAGNVATTSLTEINPLTAIAGDTISAYAIPAGGSRSFTLTGAIGKATSATTAQSLAISAINYGTTSASPTGSTITAGLSSLYKSVMF